MRYKSHFSSLTPNCLLEARAAWPADASPPFSSSPERGRGVWKTERESDVARWRTGTFRDRSYLCEREREREGGREGGREEGERENEEHRIKN